MIQSSYLVLFYGPTRTASTSLYYSHPTASPEFSITSSSETYYHYNNILHDKKYIHEHYLRGFIEPNRSILFDYEPLLFHMNATDEAISAYFDGMARYFRRILIIVTAREARNLVRSVFQYTKSLQPYLTVDTDPCLPDALGDELRFFFDYERVMRSLKMQSSLIKVEVVPFSRLLSDPNRIVSSLIGFDCKSVKNVPFYRLPILHLNASSYTPSALQRFSALPSFLPSSIKRSRRIELAKNFLSLIISRRSDKPYLSDNTILSLTQMLCPFTSSLSEEELVKQLQSFQ
jgi:hypothetical protein